MRKKILITGGSGVVGSTVAPLFLNDANYDVHLLLRAGSVDVLNKRVQSLKSFWGKDLNGKSSINALAGDVCLPRLGLQEKEYHSLCDGLTHILHSAANVKLDMSLSESMRNAVDATENILQLQRDAKGVKLDFVSTVGVNGRRLEPLEEVEITEPREFFNTYEAGKAEAENRVFKAMRSGAAVTIHRPSMVVGHSRTGKIIHFQVFYFLLRLISGLSSKGWIPKLGPVKLDTVPSDFVAQVLYRSANTDAFTGRILHHCSGPDQSVTIDWLREKFRGKLTVRKLPCPKLHEVPVEIFRLLPLLGHLPMSSKWKTRLRLLPQFLAYASQRQRFMMQITSELLKKEGAIIPAPINYLENVMDFYLDPLLSS